MEKILSAYQGKIERVCRYNGHGTRELKEYWTKELSMGGRGAVQKASLVFQAMEGAKQAGARKLRLSENTIVLQENKVLPSGRAFEVIIKALTPSAESVDRYADRLHRNLQPGQPIRKLPDRDHNLVASALWISVGQVKILLGSDVEIGTDDQTGWRGVVNNPDLPDLRVHALKVAHHGSSNAHYPPAWALHAHENLTALITPFSGSMPPLPKNSDIARIKRLSGRTGLTTEMRWESSDHHYPREVAKRMKRITRNWMVKRPHREIGFLRLRFNLDGILIEAKASNPSRWYDGSFRQASVA